MPIATVENRGGESGPSLSSLSGLSSRSLCYVQLPLTLSNQHLQVAPCTAYGRSARKCVIGLELGRGSISCKVGESRPKLVTVHTANRSK